MRHEPPTTMHGATEFGPRVAHTGTDEILQEAIQVSQEAGNSSVSYDPQ